MLEAHNISAKFGNKTIFENISFQLKPGEIYSIIGPSGCGKTTLGRMLAGLEKPKSGKIILDGKEMQINNKRWPIQYLYQTPLQAMNPRWKIRKIMTEAGELDLIHAKRLGVQMEWLDRYPHELSGGQLQRVSILRALSIKPKFLIADEITAALDPIAQVEIWKFLIHLLKEHEMGIIVISHDEKLLGQIIPIENTLSLLPSDS